MQEPPPRMTIDRLPSYGNAERLPVQPTRKGSQKVRSNLRFGLSECIALLFLVRFPSLFAVANAGMANAGAANAGVDVSATTGIRPLCVVYDFWTRLTVRATTRYELKQGVDIQ